MAVLKIVPKLYQEKISEKLKEEISLVTTGEAKYYNRLYKFFQYTDIQCTADINYETRKMYMDSVEKEDISEKYKAELLSLFDRLKIENMPDVYRVSLRFLVRPFIRTHCALFHCKKLLAQNQQQRAYNDTGINRFPVGDAVHQVGTKVQAV